MLTRMITKTAPALAVALFAFGVLAVRDVTSNAPAFNEALTHPAITGDVRVGITSDMYDESKYLFQLGYGYLNGDALVFAGIEASDEAASIETAQARYQTARAHLERSVSLDPANGVAWLFYAQALAAVGTPQEASQALKRSWELAPNTARFAFTRLMIVQTLRARLNDKSAFADMVAADKEVLAQKAPRALELLPQ
jgi:tetratricopeptide (TPR) repeat protein